MGLVRKPARKEKLARPNGAISNQNRAGGSNEERMARLGGETSNRLFAELEAWNTYLSATASTVFEDAAPQEIASEEPGGPSTDPPAFEVPEGPGGVS